MLFYVYIINMHHFYKGTGIIVLEESEEKYYIKYETKMSTWRPCFYNFYTKN